MRFGSGKVISQRGGGGGENGEGAYLCMCDRQYTFAIIITIALSIQNEDGMKQLSQHHTLFYCTNRIGGIKIIQY